MEFPCRIADPASTDQFPFFHCLSNPYSSFIPEISVVLSPKSVCKNCNFSGFCRSHIYVFSPSSGFHINSHSHIYVFSPSSGLQISCKLPTDILFILFIGPAFFFPALAASYSILISLNPAFFQILNQFQTGLQLQSAVSSNLFHGSFILPYMCWCN